MLEHAEPPVFGDIALELADRIDAAAAEGIDAAQLQELIVEERQLVEHLQRRYEGIPELQQQLTRIDDSLRELEGALTTVGPSPDPRD